MGTSCDGYAFARSVLDFLGLCAKISGARNPAPNDGTYSAKGPRVKEKPGKNPPKYKDLAVSKGE
jgi:hypothetical protein